MASGLAPVSIGTDGGGSIRIPASLCGLFGLKTTAGTLFSFPNETLFVSKEFLSFDLRNYERKCAKVIHRLVRTSRLDWRIPDMSNQWSDWTSFDILS